MGKEAGKRVHEKCPSSECFYIIIELAKHMLKRRVRKEVLQIKKERKRNKVDNYIEKYKWIREK